MKIDIGGGTNPAGGWVNIDPVHGVQEQHRVRVQDGLPFDDNTIEAARASHVLEHIPAGDDRIKAMNEVHRVLKSGGTFEIILPLVGYTENEVGHLVRGWQPYADPTHVAYWWFPESLLYFCEGPFKPHADYGICIWDTLHEEDWEVRGGWEGYAVLRKP